MKLTQDRGSNSCLPSGGALGRGRTRTGGTFVGYIFNGLAL
jgi:hypothetical protein